ncbi:MAG TPA: Gfo/Idh/MocA family oxidoreductase [Bryobacteraceae bacterium]|jgi:glucose-fructose oxidoreductase|nr:Gfo/Idh/MocA family oxidoreductase [Bryobacteraceae bacterium]
MALFGSKDDATKFRYAVVGLGWIAQEAILPSFKDMHHSTLAALVTGDPEKARDLSEKYHVSQIVDYEGYDALLRSGDIDVVYIALPNNMHKDFTVRAARAGIHVLCEKPMADTVAECEEMIDACARNSVKLMIAYRLHFEPANLNAIERVQSSELGEPRIFNSVFSQQTPAGNPRLQREMGGGPLMDLGIYQINAARYLFREEPSQVTAAGANNGDPRFEEVHEMVSGILRFPRDRLASFTCSFGAAPTDSYRVIGTDGELQLKPSFEYGEKPKMTLTVDGKEQEITFHTTDQFGGEIEYFSRCILEDKEPEPSGYEGLADIRIIQALLESMRAGQPVNLAPYTRDLRPGETQKVEKAPVKYEKKLVHAQAASAH